MVPSLGAKTLCALYKLDPAMEYPDFLERLRSPEVTRIIRNVSVVERLQAPGYLKELMDSAEQSIEAHIQHGITVLSLADEGYPPSLRAIADPPAVLYGKGNVGALQNIKSVAVVGTRKPTPIGVEITQRVASGFAQRGFAIVSGLAKGIDAAGHRGALMSRAITIAVMAGSLDKVYPRENVGSSEEILHHDGLLVSEHPLGRAIQRSDFVRRDRIQSGLSLGVCPIQTDVDGGTMHTVQFAHEQRRLLFFPKIVEDASLPVYQGILKIQKDYPTEELENRSDYARMEHIMMERVAPNLIYSSRITIDGLS